MQRHSLAIGVLIPTDPSRAPAPANERPIGRAALALRNEGLEIVFGDQLVDGAMTGWTAESAGWRAVDNHPIAAVHDRFPSQMRADRFQQILSGLGSLPMGNPFAITQLCRDKVASQQLLVASGIEMPQLEVDPDRFEDRLNQWGAAFLKPRYGALGIGVTRVHPGDPLPRTLPGVVPDRPDPAILQRAIPPPVAWAGRTVRVLAQRIPGASWHLCTPVVRQSTADAVVNAARGAQVVPGPDTLSRRTLEAIHRTVIAVTEAISTHSDGLHAVEIGVDLVLDPENQPHLIEVNSRPRGRLEALASHDAERFRTAHVEACARPLRYLAWITTTGAPDGGRIESAAINIDP